MDIFLSLNALTDSSVCIRLLCNKSHRQKFSNINDSFPNTTTYTDSFVFTHCDLATDLVSQYWNCIFPSLFDSHVCNVIQYASPLRQIICNFLGIFFFLNLDVPSTQIWTQTDCKNRTSYLQSFKVCATNDSACVRRRRSRIMSTPYTGICWPVFVELFFSHADDLQTWSSDLNEVAVSFIFLGHIFLNF